MGVALVTKQVVTVDKGDDVLGSFFTRSAILILKDEQQSRVLHL